MKAKIFCIFWIINFVCLGQNKLITKTGKINFEASVPSFEEVKAKNEGVSCVLYRNSGEINSLVLIKGFRFKIPLMEEHFNSMYMESDSYPKAMFKGKIENFDSSKLTASPQDYIINGKMKMHGKTVKISIPAQIKKTSDGIEIKSDFKLNSEDYGIEIPNAISKKVSKIIAVNLDATLKQKG